MPESGRKSTKELKAHHKFYAFSAQSAPALEVEAGEELVTVLLKTGDRVSVYRVGVVGRKPER